VGDRDGVCVWKTDPFVESRLGAGLSSRTSLVDDIEELCVEVKRYLVSLVGFIGHCRRRCGRCGRWDGWWYTLRSHP
jgi:hypothetical protein